MRISDWSSDGCSSDLPGIFSARWAGPDRDFGLATQLVWDNLTAKGPEAGHDAHFVCALALAWPDGHVEAFEGRVDGLIIWPPRGANGFGYDPIFEPKGHNKIGRAHV